MDQRYEFDPHEIRRIAVAATCDPETVRRYLSALPVRPMSRSRIERSLRRLKLGHVVKAEA